MGGEERREHVTHYSATPCSSWVSRWYMYDVTTCRFRVGASRWSRWVGRRQNKREWARKEISRVVCLRLLLPFGDSAGSTPRWSVTGTVDGMGDKTVDRSTRRQEESQKGARDWCWYHKRPDTEYGQCMYVRLCKNCIVPTQGLESKVKRNTRV